MQVKSIELWKEHDIEGQENESAQRAVKFLKENGHPEAQQVCQRIFSNSRNSVEIDGIATAIQCAAIVEAKTILTLTYVERFMKTIVELRCSLSFKMHAQQ